MSSHRPSNHLGKHVPISELEPGRRVRSVFLVQSKRSDTTRKGDPYLSLALGDRTGTVQGRVWDNAERYGALFESSDYVFVDALCETYRGEIQLRVQHLERVSASAVDESEFVKASAFDPDEMLERLRALLADVVTTPALGRILEALLADDEIRQGLRRAPAAKVNHHAYLAGLLEHTLSMCELAASIGRHYERQYGSLLRTELLVAGALLHDLGKIWELSAGRTVEYTDIGNLVGHITLGVERLSRVVDELGVDDDDLVLRLKHMILSHHGEPEYGAVVKPKTPEAQVLHFVDQIDSRMNMFAGALDGLEAGWSSWVSPLRRTVYAGPVPTPAEADSESTPISGTAPAAAPPVPPPRPRRTGYEPAPNGSSAGGHPAWADDEDLINAALVGGADPPLPDDDSNEDPSDPEYLAGEVGYEDPTEPATADDEAPFERLAAAGIDDVDEPDQTDEADAEFGLTPAPPTGELQVDDEPRPVEEPSTGPVLDAFTLDLFGS